MLISTQAPAPPYAEALGALDLSNPFATAPANSLWRWLLKHRHDEPPTRAACGDRDCWFPNVVLLTLDAFGVSTRAFPAAADARAFFARFGALMAWGLEGGPGGRPTFAQRQLVRDFVRSGQKNAASFCCRVALGRSCASVPAARAALGRDPRRVCGVVEALVNATGLDVWRAALARAPGDASRLYARTIV